MKCLYWGQGALGGWGRGYIWPKVSLPKVVPNLAMRCPYSMWGKGSKGWGIRVVGAGGTSDQRSACSKKYQTCPQDVFTGWRKEGVRGAGGIRGFGVVGVIWPMTGLPKIVPNLVSLTWSNTNLGSWMSLLEGHIWPKVSLTWNSSKVGHEMSLLGGTSDQRSAWCEVVPLLATRCFYCGGYIWPKVSLSWSSSKLAHEMSLLGVCLTRG